MPHLYIRYSILIATDKKFKLVTTSHKTVSILLFLVSFAGVPSGLKYQVWLVFVLSFAIDSFDFTPNVARLDCKHILCFPSSVTYYKYVP